MMPARLPHVILKIRAEGACHDAFERRSDCRRYAGVGRSGSYQSGGCSIAANQDANRRRTGYDRLQCAPLLPALLSPVLPALLLRTALLLSAVSLCLAGAVPAGSGFRAVLVVSDDWTLMD